ncbi:SCP2 sterol-binding domain-containing protein [Actinokineospora auranticolor]|uniref:SCP-2 sterol transfer family protein n=1 Tax=Actinokineospora auranticolor TaxID=155976 RepID=A0A2S6GS21_9PSEU|nr:SCP2 sterol-binding domain-containing protein [Actinokineospora auranticolor]PPK67986.1 SCP-2 sterol transfer family protein [Actinokineospora auranticolor]
MTESDRPPDTADDAIGHTPGPWRDPGARVNLDAFADAVDPARLTPDEFVRLVEVLDTLGRARAGVDLATMRTDTFLRFLRRTTPAHLDALTAHPALRQVVFTEVFRRMSDHLDPTRTATLRAVIHWRFTGAVEDRFETVIDHGTCTSGRSPTADPRVTITLAPTDFLRALTGEVNLPLLFLTGKVRVKGDLPFAATLIAHFDLPGR